MRVFGLIGRNLSHSFSNDYFSEKFRREGIEDAVYKVFEMDTMTGLKDLVKQEKVVGLNVTLPFKEKVINYLDVLDPTVKKIGAANTILVHKGKLHGFNTDVSGFRESLKPFLRKKGYSALVIGTGGAAKSVSYVLREQEIQHYFVSRNPSFMNELSYDQISAGIINTHHLIINASPQGMYPYPETFPNIPYQHLTKEHLLYDLVYNPEETAFMKKGRARGAWAVNGLKMLHLQAEKSWELWNRKRD